MSKFTTELRYICENYCGFTESKGYNDVEDIITLCADWIFGEFPIFDESYREVLEAKIIRHYYTREISEETVGLWRLRVNDKMNIIMPYYNQLYKSTLLEFNPFYDVDITRESTKKDNGNHGSVDSEISSGKNKRSATENNIGVENEKSKTNGENVSIYGENGKNSENTQTTKNNNETEARNLQKNNAKTGSESDSVNKWDLYSDTPQGGVVGIVNAGESVGSNAYLTNARHIIDGGTKTYNGVTNSESDTGTVTKVGAESGQITAQNVEEKTGNQANNYSENNETGKSVQGAKNETEENDNSTSRQRIGQNTISNMSEYIEHVVGKQGGHSYSKMLLEFRETMLNIDKMVIEELGALFFGLWE